MKNIKLLLAGLILVQLGLTSCKKLELEKTEKNTISDPKKFTEIKTSKEFTWSTNKTIAIDFPARANDARVAVLKVVDASGNVYFKKLQKANEKFVGSIQVPSHMKSLIYVYGGIQKEFSTQSPSLTITL
ncbi:MAG: hypothetical protein MH472_03205 [Bacteroidia bacterium]|nr:hypothetical protein [Bacteroidia bacterium]